MTLDEYRRFYVDFIITILGPAVMREAHCDLKLGADPVRQAEYENLKNGLVVLALVSFVESNFLQAGQLKALRQFEPCAPPLPAGINATHLSCFVYVRDCIAHGPSAQLLSHGKNTTGFVSAVGSNAFPWATMRGSTLSVSDAALHELHLIVLRFYGEAV